MIIDHEFVGEVPRLRGSAVRSDLDRIAAGTAEQERLSVSEYFDRAVRTGMSCTTCPANQ